MGKIVDRKPKAIEIALAVFIITLFMIASINFSNVSLPSSQRITERAAAASTPARTTSADTPRVIYMQGRSVMAGWFTHWGSDTSRPVRKGRFKLYYRELDSPPDIIDSVRRYVKKAKPKTIFFFKLCFEDFEGGSQADATTNLSQNKDYVRQVYRAVSRKRGGKLIIGNALPKVSSDTDSWLVWNHRRYNKWLRTVADKHPNRVFIFDQYHLLTNPKGRLKSAFAVDPYDSHLNDKAYTVMDKSFFRLLRKHF